MGHLLSDELGLIEAGDVTGREKGTEMAERHLARSGTEELTGGETE